MNAPPEPVAEPRIAALLQHARALNRDGHTGQAEQQWRALLALDPRHAEAAFNLGVACVGRGEAEQALSLLQRAAEGAPRETTVQLYLAATHRLREDPVAEMAALTSALAIDPYLFAALLQKAQLLERTGRPRQASVVYRNAIKIAPPEERLPAPFRAALAHATQVVREGEDTLQVHLDSTLAGLRARHQGAALARFDETVQVTIGRRKVHVQQPMKLHMPQLAPIQFHDPTLFPWLAELNAASDAIRAELLAVLAAPGEEIKPYIRYRTGEPVNQWSELNHSPRWGSYFFWRDGQCVETHCARCPRTAAVLESLPLAHVPGFGPSAMFSVLAPRTHIPPHTGDTNTRLIVHLPLVVPPGCRFRVGSETREWRAGEAFVFDDTFEHEAFNDSDQTRVILMFDVWNPSLSVAERELVGGLLAGMRDYYEVEGA